MNMHSLPRIHPCSCLVALLLIISACRSAQPITYTRTVHDTLILTPAVRTDTLWRAAPRDTLVLREGKLELRIQKQHDTLRLQGQCHPDTLRIPLVREVVRVHEGPTRTRPLLLGQALGAMAMLVLLLLIKR